MRRPRKDRGRSGIRIFRSDGIGKSTDFYVVQDGYITRASGFDDRGRILFEERRFLSQVLKPDLTWSNWLFPFDRMAEVFRVTQTHRTFSEANDVVVPAGHFSNCIRIETEAVYRDSSSQEAEARRIRYLDWYAPNVGLVKTLVLESGFFGSEIARVDLISFVESQVKPASHWDKEQSIPKRH